MYSSSSASGASLVFSVRSPVSASEVPKKITPSNEKQRPSNDAVEGRQGIIKLEERKVASTSSRTKSRHVR